MLALHSLTRFPTYSSYRVPRHLVGPSLALKTLMPVWPPNVLATHICIMSPLNKYRFMMILIRTTLLIVISLLANSLPFRYFVTKARSFRLSLFSSYPVLIRGSGPQLGTFLGYNIRRWKRERPGDSSYPGVDVDC